MSDDTKPSFGLRLPQHVVDGIDSYRLALPYPPRRSTVMARIIEEWVESQAKKPRVTLEEGYG
jgi:hypothetical protein